MDSTKIVQNITKKIVSKFARVEIVQQQQKNLNIKFVAFRMMEYLEVYFKQLKFKTDADGHRRHSTT